MAQDKHGHIIILGDTVDVVYAGDTHTAIVEHIDEHVHNGPPAALKLSLQTHIHVPASSVTLSAGAKRPTPDQDHPTDTKPDQPQATTPTATPPHKTPAPPPHHHKTPTRHTPHRPTRPKT